MLAELGGPTMFARIGVMRALNRRVGRVSELGPACVKTAFDDMILLQFGRRIR